MSGSKPTPAVAGRYRLRRPAPSDLTAVTAWSAKDNVLDSPVRVLLLSGDYARKAVEAARRSSLVVDRRIVRVLDAGRTSIGEVDAPYVVTERPTGRTLGQIVDSGLLNASEVRAIIGEAAEAIAAAHDRGVYHGALRPGSIRVANGSLTVSGLGVDGALAGIDRSSPFAASNDSRALAALGYYALTARWPIGGLDASWLTPGSAPLAAEVDASGGIRPLSEVVPHVDAGLADVLMRALSGGQGVDTPEALAKALKPWGSIPTLVGRASRPGPTPAAATPLAAGSAFAATPTPEAGGGAGEPLPLPALIPPRPATGRIPRVSATVSPIEATTAAAFSQDATTKAGASLAAAAAVEPASASTAAGLPSAASAEAPVASLAQAAPIAPPTWARIGEVPVRPAGTAGKSPARGVRAAPIMLVLGLLGLVGGGAWALGQLRDSAPVITEVSPDPTQRPADPRPTPSPPALPVIVSINQIGDAGDCGGEQPEDVARIVDGDPTTYWQTCTYTSATFGGQRDGIGIALRLREPARVASITLSTDSEGGNVQLRATTANAPTIGSVLAEGPIYPTTVLDLSHPTFSESFVLWFDELPQTDDEFRLKIQSITIE